MNEPPDNATPPNFVSIVRSIRFVFVAIVLGLSYFTIRASFAIQPLDQIFHDMLGDEKLPAITRFVISARPVFCAASILVPLGGVLLLFMRNLARSFYVMGILMFVMIVQFIVTYQALAAPLGEILKKMSSGGGDS